MKAWMGSNFGKFATELLPLIDVGIEFLFNNLKTNRPIKTKFCKHIIIDRIYFGTVNRCFTQIGSIDINHDWVKNYACFLSQCVYISERLAIVTKRSEVTFFGFS